MRFPIRMTLIRLLLLGSLSAASIISRTAGTDSYTALYNFTSQQSGEVDLQKGEVVSVIQQNASGWWLIEKPDGSMRGWTPGSYLSKISSSASSSATQTKASISNTLPSTTSSKSTTSRRPSTESRKSSSTIKSSSRGARKSSSSTSSYPSAKTGKSSSISTTNQRITASRNTTSIQSPTRIRLSSLTQSGAISSEPSLTTTPVLPSSIPAAVSSIFSSSESRAPSAFPTTTVDTSSLYQPDSTASGTPTLQSSNNNGLMSSNAAPLAFASTTSALPDSTSSIMPSIAEPVKFSNSSLPSVAQSSTLFSNGSNSLTSSSATSVSAASSNSIACLLNCGPTALPLANVTSQASASSTSTAAVPPECADPGGVNGITTACWNALNMSQYVKDWSLLHRDACHAQTSFAQCFLQVLDTGMNDCISISSGTCPPPSWIQFKDHNMSVRDFYVAYNIYAVWTFFNSYYTAIGNARSAATDSVAGIVALLDPPKANNAELANINFALGIGLTFINFEGFIAGPLVQSLVGFVVNAVRQIPQIARYLFPQAPGDTKFVQLGQISNQMGTLTVNLQQNVATALSVIQNDTSNFLAMTGTGAFSNNPVVKMNQQSDSLLTALNTYVISLCLQANNWQVSRAIDTDVNQLMANGTKTTWNITDCGTGYDGESVCGAYYWNKTIDVSYTLTNTDNMFANPAPIMQQFFANWTTPQLLFDGALQCQMAKGTGNPNINPTSGATDVTSTPCLSSVKICTWDLNPDHFGTQYEYTDCDTQNHFATQGCSHCDATTDFCTNVPSSYLGGYLLNSGAEAPQYTFCNDDHTLLATK